MSGLCRRVWAWLRANVLNASHRTDSQRIWRKTTCLLWRSVQWIVEMQVASCTLKILEVGHREISGSFQKLFLSSFPTAMKSYNSLALILKGLIWICLSLNSKWSLQPSFRLSRGHACADAFVGTAPRGRTCRSCAAATDFAARGGDDRDDQNKNKKQNRNGIPGICCVMEINWWLLGLHQLAILFRYTEWIFMVTFEFFFDQTLKYVWFNPRVMRLQDAAFLAGGGDGLEAFRIFHYLPTVDRQGKVNQVNQVNLEFFDDLKTSHFGCSRCGGRAPSTAELLWSSDHTDWGFLATSWSDTVKVEGSSTSITSILRI